MSKFAYPRTPRDESVVDDYHGRKVKDPYRALEDPDSISTKEWVQQQQDVFDNLKQEFKYREVFAQKMKEMRNYPRYGTPFKEGKNYFYFFNEGLQNQDVLYIVGDSLDNPRKVFIDPNTFSEDGTASIGTYAFSKPDGRYVAYCVHNSGSDWTTIRIKNVETGEDLKEELQWVKFSSIAWKKEEGFYYARYPAPNTSDQGTETDVNKLQKLCYHKLGDDQEKDQLIFYEPTEPDWMYSASVSYDFRYVVINIAKSCEHANKVYYFDLNEPWKERSTGGFQPVRLIDHDFKSEFDFFTNNGTLFFFKTNDDAPNNKIVSMDITNPSSLKDVVPTKDILLQWNHCVADHFILGYLKDVVDVMEIYNMDGQYVKTISIPLGEVAATSGKRDQTELFFKFNSFLHAGSIFKYDFTTKSETKIRDTEVKGLNPEDFVTKQEFFTSKDGTKVPMFIVHRKDLIIDANYPHPTMLYGYGGFNVSLQPSFSVSRVLWMQYFRGVYAMANIRGGEEYGEAWHQGGILHKKQNVFDDFIAAAQYLIDHHYTKPEKLTINGGSNGGLLVAACANQAPHLFGAVWSQVPVADMLRFHKFTIGYAWVSDFGCSDNPDHVNFLLQYSPIHNVRSDIRYPAILVTTADHDDRVVPLHSFKYVAELQHQLGSKDFQDLPLVIRIESKAGHGAGKSLAKQIEEAADAYAFIAHYTGATWSE